MICLIPYAQLEGDALADGSGCPVGPRLVALFLTKLAPVFPLRNCMIHKLFLQRAFNAAGDLVRSVEHRQGRRSPPFTHLDFLAIIVDGELNNSADTILVDSILDYARDFWALI